MAKIYVLPQVEFDELCKKECWIDDTADKLQDKAFISIIGTQECRTYYLEEPNVSHWFKKNHSNVLNLDFDDLSEDIVWKGHTFKAMTENQAHKMFQFIEVNKGKDFYIHCRAGISRSRAVGMFIANFYNDIYKDSDDVKTSIFNHQVYRLLTNEHYKKYKEEDK